jgi:quercetin dioxygenase-like cupin family protein
MNLADVQSIDWAVVPSSTVHGSIARQTVTSDRFTVVRYEFPAGAVFPRHAHPESQVTLVASGIFTFDFGDATRIVRKGEAIVIPGDVPHEGRAEHGPATILCVLTPARRT